MLKNCLIVALGFGIVVLALSFTNMGNAIAQVIQQVRVVNLPTQAVPTIAQGTTNVAGNVGINGTVTLAPETKVEVTKLPPQSHFAINQHFTIALLPLAGGSPMLPVSSGGLLDCTVRQIDGVWIKCELPNPHPGVGTPPSVFVNTILIVASDR